MQGERLQDELVKAKKGHLSTWNQGPVGREAWALET